ncbi:hypothetical protein HQ563_08710 [bacterium]|nr:hypothetical protein [bacterium]
MARRIVSVVMCLAVSVSVLTGCMFNTPDRVVKRFVSRLKWMRWQGMAELVDWPRSSQYVPDIPASNEGENDAKRDVMLRIAENLSGFPVRQKTPEQIRHGFIYLKLARLSHMKDGDGWAWLKVTVSTDQHAKTVEVLVIKINRIWRIVLTENILE